MHPEPIQVLPEPASDGSALINALRVLRERWPIPLATLVIGAIVAFAIAQGTVKQYHASSALLVKASNLPALIDPSQAQAQDSTTLARTQADDVALVTSSAVATIAKTELGSPQTVGALQGSVSASAGATNDLITIEATDTDPGRAARIANAFATAVVTYLTNSAQAQVAAGQSQLQTELAQLPKNDPGRPALEAGLKQVIALRAVTNGGAQIAESAATPTSPSSPSVKRDTLVGGIVGLVIGLIVIFLLDTFDRRVKTAEMLERLYGLSSLSSIPLRRRARPGVRTSQASLEPFRILRDGLSHVSLRQDVRVVLVTSAAEGEGKTAVASGLARAVAAAGRKVVLIEADVHRPAVHREFGLARHGVAGLMNRLVQRAGESDLTQRVANIPCLSILLSGPFTPNSAELLRLPAMTDVLARFKQDFEFVIIDTPPLLPVADTQVLLDNALIDVVLIVARPNVTVREHVRPTRAILRRHTGKGFGLVLNGVREKAGGYFGYTGEYQDDDALLPDATPVYPPRSSDAADHIVPDDALDPAARLR